MKPMHTAASNLIRVRIEGEQPSKTSNAGSPCSGMCSFLRIVTMCCNCQFEQYGLVKSIQEMYVSLSQIKTVKFPKLHVNFTRRQTENTGLKNQKWPKMGHI
jgi:hypothetical protein